MVSARSIPIENPTPLARQRYHYRSQNQKNVEGNKNDTSVTLSFGGVNFCLSPSDVACPNMGKSICDEAPLFSIAKKANGIQVNMSNFSGTLFVFSNNEERLQNAIEDVVDKEKRLESDPFTYSQKSITSRYTSATPSPPGSPHDKKLQQMVDAMPAMIVPTNSLNVNHTKNKNDSMSKVRLSRPSRPS